MNYVCLVGEPIAWESHVLEVLEGDPTADVRQCAFLLRIKYSENVLCTMFYEGGDAEAAKLEHAKYAIVVGNIVEFKKQHISLHISLNAHQCFDKKPNDFDVMEFYYKTMRALYIDPPFVD